MKQVVLSIWFLIFNVINLQAQQTAANGANSSIPELWVNYQPYVSEPVRNVSAGQQGEMDIKRVGMNAPTRFLSVDRFADKYPSMTPYQYAANNPAYFIDVNGDSLWITYKGNDYLYESGKLFLNGTEYTGKKKGFLGQVFNALQKISNGGTVGETLITELVENEQNTFIQKSTLNKDYFQAKGSNRTVYWDPSLKLGGLDVNGDRQRPSFVSLAHELGHAFDALDGHMDRGNWEKLSNGAFIDNKEKMASHIENLIRAEHKLPLREFYAIDRGKGVGRLLMPGTRISAVYGSRLFPIVY